MKQRDAERAILKMWQSLPDTEKYDSHCGFILNGWLLENRPDLLSFKFSGDKYQKINGWVLSWQSHYPRHQL